MKQLVLSDIKYTTNLLLPFICTSSLVVYYTHKDATYHQSFYYF